ncbi:aminotransferase class I/II-fold pyridoxal phosphate-dependent enzyme [Candidatus Berkiella cookevillensis]|uniref:Aminotransferase class I/II-fold pyridoxal phosphate-dependent enzyme n=1 Tax=Candidatus Berkiella cookevillensis TaxID=437022 RepID=A0A0Q9YGB2_9GAMM|nr:aminotransferase class I/II-fold pyridoxal phosphate-dependent enzyme [Candidatus Berkiella cookevillensis]MCS5707586.1 aminotransferase class I/II-fold pyridoxal phosphate-dependent enzyme [Candidatus Berkiella cookevillensis]
MDKKYKFKTRAIHAGFSGDATGAVMPPIYLSTTYKQREPAKPIGDFEYSRSSNPNRSYLETALASLEGGTHGLCFSSGCAALATLLQSLAPNSHVVIGDDVYGGTVRLFAKVFAEKGITFSQVDCSDATAFKNALKPNTQLIWVETPSNPMLKITDIAQICEIKSKYASKAYVFIDNTFATPYLQNPLECGADGVCHSTTKYIGGHSDVVGGALIVKEDTLAENLRFYQNAMGAVPSPMDCFLLLRSLKTLGIRMEEHCKNAEKIVDFLHTQPCVKQIHYPGLKNHLHHDVARTQMRGFGGMISANFNFNIEQVKKLLGRLQLFTLAESLGGVESLIEHPALMTHATVSPQQRKLLGIDDGLLRFSVGIEESDDLIDDLKQALSNL